MTLANLPVNRFAESLERRGELTAYETLLKDNFNPATLSGLMCRSLISVSWDGYLYDCDFNQMLEMPLEGLESLSHSGRSIPSRMSSVGIYVQRSIALVVLRERDQAAVVR